MTDRRNEAPKETDGGNQQELRLQNDDMGSLGSRMGLKQ